MLTVFAHAGSRTVQAAAVDPAWLDRGSGVTVWVDLAAPTPDEAAILRSVFHFHDLAVEDALGTLEFPKIEAYDGYLYLILHGIDFAASRHRFQTHDTDFFVGPNYLVTIHDGQTRTIAGLRDLAARNDRIVGEGPPALLHRIVDAMVDHYRPEVDGLEDKLDALEEEVFSEPAADTIKKILALKQEVVSLRRVTTPQRDAIGRLARREFAMIDTEMAYRFRDVHDHLVQLSDEALIFQDRITGILEAHLSNVSNRLNEVMKVLTIIATIFMPLTVLTSMYGMNVGLPHFPGGESAQFWWVLAVMVALSSLMLWWFRRRGWI